MKLEDITEGPNTRTFYVFGFQNKKGRYRITGIKRGKQGVYNISMGNNDVTYDPKGDSKLKFSDKLGNPIKVESILHHMSDQPPRHPRAVVDPD